MDTRSDQKTNAQNDIRISVMMFIDRYFHHIANNDTAVDIQKSLADLKNIDFDYIDFIKKINAAQKTCKVYVLKEKKDELKPQNMLPFTGIHIPDFDSFFTNNSFNYSSCTNMEDIQRLNDKGLVAPLAEDEVAQLRKNTKFRVIYSEVPYVLPSGEIKMVPIITACSINLLSSENDKKKYMAGNSLNEEKFAEDICKIAKLILFTAKDNNLGSDKKNPFIIADFGCGVYLNSLSEENKITAKNIIYKSFLEASEIYQVHVEWCIWKMSKTANDRTKKMNESVFKNASYIQAVVGELADKPQLNNGSDRTIGGSFTHPNPTTTEEQVAQKSALLFVQSAFNPELRNQLNNAQQVQLPYLIHEACVIDLGQQGFVHVKFNLKDEAIALTKILYDIDQNLFCRKDNKAVKVVYGSGSKGDESPFYIRLYSNQYDNLIDLVNNKKVIFANHSHPSFCLYDDILLKKIRLKTSNFMNEIELDSINKNKELDKFFDDFYKIVNKKDLNNNQKLKEIKLLFEGKMNEFNKNNKTPNKTPFHTQTKNLLNGVFLLLTNFNTCSPSVSGMFTQGQQQSTPVNNNSNSSSSMRNLN